MDAPLDPNPVGATGISGASMGHAPVLLEKTTAGHVVNPLEDGTHPCCPVDLFARSIASAAYARVN